VTSDGVIYAASLATGAGQWTIYRWATQASNPTLAASIAVTERTGDAFSISGSGTNTILYGSGAGNAGGVAGSINIYMLNTFNGLNFFQESKINVVTSGGVSQWANRAIDPVTNSLTSDLWITAGGGPARRITVGPRSGDVRVGTAVFAIADGVGNGQASVGYGGMRHLTTPNNKKFLIFAGGNNSNAGTRMTTLLVTDEENVTTYGKDSLYRGEDPSSVSYVTNANGTGDAAYKQEANGEYTVFYLSTNNGIQATKTGLEILPVNLSLFNASLRQQGALLNWTTTTENNNSGFQIEKSVNGTDFASIGFVASLANGGNSNQALQYEFADNKLGEGISYYRLKQIDKDGKSTLSAVRHVQRAFSSSFSARVRNNPVMNELNLNVNSDAPGSVQIVLTNASGVRILNTVSTINAGENNIILSATNLPKGVYYVTVGETTGKNQKTTLKILKN
jgi:hypothetical protein